MKNSKRTYQIKLVILAGIFGILSVIGFNCGRPQFQIDQNLISAGHQDAASTALSSDKLDTRYALLTSEQVFQSMLSVTGQSPASTAMINEYNSRAGGMGVTTNLNLVNGPMLIAVTSLSGIVCDGLITKEAAMTAASRQFYQNFDFTKGPSMVSASAYANTASNFAVNVWNRSPSSDEMAAFSQHYSEFMGALATTDMNSTAQTRALALSVCSAVLSSFDTYTY